MHKYDDPQECSKLVDDYFEFWTCRDESLFWACEEIDDLVREEAEVGWAIVQKLLSAARSREDLGYVASGPLEDLLRYHGATVKAPVLKELLTNDRLRYALGRAYLSDWDIEQAARSRLPNEADLPPEA